MKPLTKTETDILEELDAMNRAKMRVDMIDFCATCQSGNDELLTGADVQKVVDRLIRRGLIERQFRKWLTVTNDGHKLITRSQVLHYRYPDGKKKNGDRQECSDTKPCPQCVAAKKLRKA